MTLLERSWAFLTDPANRAVLAWLGGGLVVVLGGAWTVFTYFRPGSTATRKAGGEPAKVTAAHGSVVVGRDNRGSPITIAAAPPPSKPPLPPRRGAGAGKSRRRGKRGGKR
jgi:hypothetical protein